MRITSKGQVTIPLAIRQKLGLQPDTEVEFEIDGSCVKLRKAKASSTRGTSIVAKLRGRGDVKMTTEQIMALSRGRER
jgi:AbrB family looped-hinge helix DNA binding protein